MKVSFFKIIFSLIFFWSPLVAFAGSEHNMSGWAWSSNIGWISFNCTNDNSCAASDYGVNQNADNTLSGYGWSSSVGWIQFGGLSGFPTGGGTQAQNANVNNGALQGWARALSNGAGGWDGWISLAGTGYGVTLSGSSFAGYAWGSDVVGWVDFNGVIVGPTTLTMSGTLTPASTSCVIPDGSSNCNISFSWTTTNPISTSAITKPVDVTVATGNSGTNVAFAIPWGGETFYLYNNSILLAQSTIDSSSITCASGDQWSGTTCVPIPVNGACGELHYSCAEGISSSNLDGPASYTWVCSGINGGTNTSCSEIKAPADAGTCSDGIQNGDETAIDAGGRCGPVGSGSCTDGIKNGDETGIDTGGRCDIGTGNCSDGIKDGNETGIDVGGRCLRKKPIFIEG